jgi:hypothetical protein
LPASKLVKSFLPNCNYCLNALRPPTIGGLFFVRRPDAGGYFFTTFAQQKIQSWEEVIKKPKKERFLKDLSVKQDQQAKKRQQAISRLRRKKVN